MKVFLFDLDVMMVSPSVQTLASMEAFLSRLDELRQIPTPSREVAFQSATDLEAMTSFLTMLDPLMERGIEHEERLDIWRVARIGRNEGRNAAVLAWAIDPSETHGFGPAILDEFVAQLRLAWHARYSSNADPSFFPFPEHNAGSRVRLEVNPFAQIESRVDIAVEGRDHAVYIELKVDAREHTKGDGQLATYLSLAERRARASGRSRYGVVFIAPKLPKSVSADGLRVLIATWSDVASAIRIAVSRRPSSLSAALLSQFADHAAQL